MILSDAYKNKYQALQAAKWLQKNLKNSPKRVEKLSQDIAEFEDYMNEDLLLKINKCPRCKIEMQVFSPTALECLNCGLADTKLLLMDYHKFTNTYLEPSKQTFDHEKHFVKWINNILGINTPKKDIMPILCDYIIKNNIKQISIKSLHQILKTLKLAQYYQYTSYFYKELTGVELPFIPRDIINKAKWYFNNFTKTQENL